MLYCGISCPGQSKTRGVSQCVLCYKQQLVCIERGRSSLKAYMIECMLSKKVCSSNEAHQLSILKDGQPSGIILNEQILQMRA